jgi:hypothetical protein
LETERGMQPSFVRESLMDPIRPASRSCDISAKAGTKAVT